jgi:nucleoside 2-deoxyribosyltransferase
MSCTNPVLETYYTHAIKTAVKDCDLNCTRVDQEDFNGAITDRIKKNIDDAAVVIVDTTEDKPNCYFEAGYAVARDKIIIWLRLDAPGFIKPSLEFDVKDYPHIFYTTVSDLRRRLRERLKALIK